MHLASPFIPDLAGDTHANLTCWGPLHNSRHSGESRRFSGLNVHPEERGNGYAPAFLPDSQQFDELCKGHAKEEVCRRNCKVEASRG